MKHSDVLAETRTFLDDNANGDSNRLWSDAELAEYLNDAMGQLCRSVRMLKDSTTVQEVLATGTITLSGAAGQMDSLKVDGVDVLTGPLAFNGSINQTASDVATGINDATSSPNYTATSNGAVVTVKPVAGTGSTPNGFRVVASTSGGITATSTDMSGGSAVTEVYLVPGKGAYGLHNKILSVERVKPLSRNPLVKTSIQELDDKRPGWEAATGNPTHYFVDMDEMVLRIYPAPAEAETLKLTVYRLPLVRFATGVNSDMELKDEHISMLKDWACSRAYLKNDAETLRPDKSSYFANLFNAAIEKLKRERLLNSGGNKHVRPVRGFM